MFINFKYMDNKKVKVSYLFLLIIIINIVAAQWQKIIDINSPIPSGYHLIFVPPGTLKTQINLRWDNNNDLDLYVYKLDTPIAHYQDLIDYSVNFFNRPEQIILQSYYQALVIQIDPYILVNCDKYKVEVWFDSILSVILDSYIFINLDTSSLYQFKLQTDEQNQIGCKFKVVITNITTEIDTTFVYGQNSFQLQQLQLLTPPHQVQFDAGPQSSFLFGFSNQLQLSLQNNTLFHVQMGLYKFKTSTQWFSEFGICLDSCSNIQHGIRLSVYDFPSCICQNGYRYNKYQKKCELSCAMYDYAIQDKILSNQSCLCYDGFIWNGSLCIIDCKNIEHSTGENNPDYINKCYCNFLYEWKQAAKKCSYNPSVEDENLLTIIYILSGILLFLILVIIGYFISKKCAKTTNKVRNLQQNSRKYRKIQQPDKSQLSLAQKNKKKFTQYSQSQKDIAPIRSRQQLQKVQEQINEETKRQQLSDLNSIASN